MPWPRLSAVGNFRGGGGVAAALPASG